MEKLAPEKDLPAAHGEASSSRGAPLPTDPSLIVPQAPHGMQQFIDIYGDTMRQKHRDCRNCCVLIKVGAVSRCGLILACGDGFLYVLTTERNVDATEDYVVTFADQFEMNFSPNDVVVHRGTKLSILLICGGIGRAAKEAVKFSLQNETEEAVVYTLGYIPSAYYDANRRSVWCAPANSYFRGGNIGTAGFQHEGADIFYHNCCVGHDILNGSFVLNGRCEVIGMNLKYSSGWTMSLCLNTIQDEIATIFPDTEDMSLAGIQEYLKNKGEVEANKTNI